MSLSCGQASVALNYTWRINVAGRVYGPYSGHQIKSFASEGRVAPHSIVQAGDAGPWITAIDDPVLAQLFVKDGPESKAPKPATRVTTMDAAQGKEPALTPTARIANFVVIADLRGMGANGLTAAIAKMGEFYRLNTSVWLLRSQSTAGAIRNELVQHIGRTDSLFIVDADHGRTAWFNLGPEADAQIRRLLKSGIEKIG